MIIAIHMAVMAAGPVQVNAVDKTAVPPQPGHVVQGKTAIGSATSDMKKLLSKKFGRNA
jgi:hypothetical protein